MLSYALLKKLRGNPYIRYVSVLQINPPRVANFFYLKIDTQLDNSAAFTPAFFTVQPSLFGHTVEKYRSF